MRGHAVAVWRARARVVVAMGVCVVSIVPGSGLTAQEARPLSLSEALSIARVDNPTVLQATNQLTLNEPERWNYLFGNLLPDVTVDLFSTGYSGNLQRRATDVFGNPVDSPTADWVYFSNTRQSVNLSWQIQGLSLLNAARRRSQRVTERDLGVSSAQWTLRAQVHRQFFEALEQRELLSTEEALLEGRRIDLASAERRFEIAGASRVDVLNAEVQVAQQEIAIERQRGALEQALLQLRQTLGGNAVAEVEDEPLPLFDPTGLDDDVLVRQALTMNPSVREAEGQVTGARIGVNEAKDTWWPTIQANYRFSVLAQDQETSALFDFGYDELDLGQNFSLSLSFPALNNFFQTRENNVSAEVQLANQEIVLDQRQLEIEASVRSQLVTLRNEWRALRIAERSAEVAAQSTELAREEYRLGIRTFEELQTTVEQEANAVRQELTARYAFVDALLALEESVGSPIRPLDDGAMPPALEGR